MTLSRAWGSRQPQLNRVGLHILFPQDFLFVLTQSIQLTHPVLPLMTIMAGMIRSSSLASLRHWQVAGCIDQSFAA